MNRDVLESERQFVDEHVVVADFCGTKCLFTSLEVIAGEEITESCHVAQVIGELIGSDDVNFRAVLGWKAASGRP